MSSSWATRRPGPEDYTMEVALQVRRLRQEAGWTQAALASAVGSAGLSWSQVTVADTERGKHPLDVGELLALAAVFQVPVVDLLSPPELAVEAAIELGIDSQTLDELIVGHGGSRGSGAATWDVADELKERWGDPSIETPASDLWNQREE